MTLSRLLILTVGPVLLIGGAYALSHPAPNREQAEFTARLIDADQRTARNQAATLDVLAHECQSSADELRTRLPDDFAVTVRAPFVLAGDISEPELDRLHRETVRPVTEALWRCYFDRRPDRPVVIVALSNEPAYRQTAWRLDGYTPTAYAGYTQRAQRRLTVNLETGPGTLMHELAHVLAAGDFPEMPEWFDEGLASLHEDAAFSADRLLLTGTYNWRIRLLRDALQRRELPELEVVVRTHTFRGEGEGLNYAIVRGFCLFLQEQGLLTHYYRKFRTNAARDPSGMQTLRELFGGASAGEINADFNAWIARQEPAAR